MKRLLLIALTFIFALPCIYAEGSRPKVGLVLSGGGAKGVAHVGALKVIEEAGIPIDIVVGTSMGSIIGGLYAMGYTPAQLDSIVQHLDWMALLSDKTKRTDLTIMQKSNADKYLVSIPFNFEGFRSVFSGVLKGDNLESLFYNLSKPYNDSIDFNKLPIPYACVATDADNGEEVVFHSGYIYKAMRASMAIPTVLSPVEWNGRWLVDGGVKNNYPVDVAKEMGADIIIGVNVENMNDTTANEKSDLPPGAIGTLFKLVMIGGQEKYLKNVSATDVYIPVDMTGYSPASFGRAALDSINNRGYQAAKSKFDELLAVKKRTGEKDSSDIARRPEMSEHNLVKHYVKVHGISFKGFNSREDKWLLDNCRIRTGQYYSLRELEASVQRLQNTHPKSKIEIYFKDSLDGFSIEYVMSERYDNRMNLGMNVNTEEIASIIANADFSVNTPCPSIASVTARFGRRNALIGEYSFNPYAYGRLYFRASVEYNTINTYHQGKRFCEMSFFRPSFRVEYADQTFSSNDFLLRAGIDVDYYRMVDTLYTARAERYSTFYDNFFLNYYVGIRYDTFDKTYFPKTGSFVDVQATLYTDNSYSLGDWLPILSLSAYWQSVFSVTNRLSIIPSAFARYMFFAYGTTPLYYANKLGGYTYGKYFEMQMPFESVTHLEIFQDYDLMTGISLTFRERIFKNHYLYLTANAGVLGWIDIDEIKEGYPLTDMLFNQIIYGGALRYAYDSFLGPISASFGYSNYSGFGFYIHAGFNF